MPGSWDPSVFPNLTDDDFWETSPATRRYNCIAYAAGVENRKWWPDPMKIGYWPPNVARQETLEAFILAFGSLGYEPCPDGALEYVYEKIALYADSEGVPTHAAIQRENGVWQSKLGDCEDIAHATLECLNSEAYGAPVQFLRRPRIPRRDQLH